MVKGVRVGPVARGPLRPNSVLGRCAEVRFSFQWATSTNKEFPEPILEPGAVVPPSIVANRQFKCLPDPSFREINLAIGECDSARLLSSPEAFGNTGRVLIAAGVELSDARKGDVPRVLQGVQPVHSLPIQRGDIDGSLARFGSLNRPVDDLERGLMLAESRQRAAAIQDDPVGSLARRLIDPVGDCLRRRELDFGIAPSTCIPQRESVPEPELRFDTGIVVRRQLGDDTRERRDTVHIGCVNKAVVGGGGHRGAGEKARQLGLPSLATKRLFTLNGNGIEGFREVSGSDRQPDGLDRDDGSQRDDEHRRRPDPQSG